mgnify:CR=1 FL=1
MIPFGGIKACETDMNCFTISKYYKFIYDEHIRFFQYNSERKRNVRKMKKYVSKTVIKALQEIDKFHVTMVQAPSGALGRQWQSGSILKEAGKIMCGWILGKRR